ncbi:SD repeat-containing cell surface protein [Klebsiella pneumoniae]|uniref:SD repeat-containing cell surface protein n=1 Tax=Klebsiella pneumoniae TaxID=573 RepID=A0A377TSE6_KLEPN|nr:SD repeat-containing cell surface protein [Klebsiella pneumoniae]
MAPVSDLQVTDDVAQHTGPLTSGGLTNDATPALSGTAEAGVDGHYLRRQHGAGHRGGGWRTDTGASLRIRWARGSTASAPRWTDVAGNTSGHSPDFVLTVDTTVAPVSDLQVTDNVGEEQGVVSNGGITDDTTPTLSGTAEPGSTVTIFDKGIQIGTALVG